MFLSYIIPKYNSKGYIVFRYNMLLLNIVYILRHHFVCRWRQLLPIFDIQGW